MPPLRFVIPREGPKSESVPEVPCCTELWREVTVQGVRGKVSGGALFGGEEVGSSWSRRGAVDVSGVSED